MVNSPVLKSGPVTTTGYPYSSSHSVAFKSLDDQDLRPTRRNAVGRESSRFTEDACGANLSNETGCAVQFIICNKTRPLQGFFFLSPGCCWLPVTIQRAVCISAFCRRRHRGSRCHTDLFFFFSSSSRDVTVTIFAVNNSFCPHYAGYCGKSCVADSFTNTSPKDRPLYYPWVFPVSWPTDMNFPEVPATTTNFTATDTFPCHGDPHVRNISSDQYTAIRKGHSSLRSNHRT
ncbi:hypothetical protein J6590_020384 [Homalodisca vitripennis]|nr:hypothetical protein J6590_020384 [Homalodisca vitripennis]